MTCINAYMTTIMKMSQAQSTSSVHEQEMPVKVSRAQASEHRERIIAEAANLYRERGVMGIGVVDLMKRVGLTHGGFYGHFASKEELVALACRRAVEDMIEEWKALAAGTRGDPLLAVTRPYLSEAHRDRPATGCLMAALGPELSRQAKPIRQAVTDCFQAVLATLTCLAAGRSQRQKRKAAITAFAGMVGALVIARAIDDPEVSREVLDTVSAFIADSQKSAA